MERTSEIIRRQRFVIENGCHVRDGIIIVLEGQFRCTIQGVSCCAQKNDICVFPRGVLFNREVLEPIRCIYLQFEEFPIPLAPGLLKTSDRSRTESTIAYLARAVEEGNGELTEHFLQDLFWMHRPPEHRHPVRDELVTKSIRYMDEGYAGQITLEQLAVHCAASKQTLIRKFRESTGQTPMQYLSSIRISESKRLLRDTDMTISQIARECGFENVYYFSNCFLRLAGTRPSEYRRNVGL